MPDDLPKPSDAALDFLKRHDCTFEPIDFMALVLDEFHAEQQQRNQDVNRQKLADNIKAWVEDLQPGDLKNRSTAELQDELHRRMTEEVQEELRCRMTAPPCACPHGHIDWDECPDCRH